MVRDDAALPVAHHALLLQPGDDAIDRLVEILHLDGRLVAPGGEKRRLVDEIGEIGAGESGRPGCEHFQVDVRADLHVLDVNAENLLSALHVWLVDEDLPIEAAGTEQGRVEHLWPIRRAHDDDALPRVEAVHLREELIEGLLALLVAAHRRLDPDLAERVELVDEDDARRLDLGLSEEIADPRGPDADEHLDELRSAQARRTAPWLRRPPPARAASSRCPAGRRAAHPSESARRCSCTSSGSSGTRRSPGAPLPPRRRLRRRQTGRSRRLRRRSSRGCGRTTSRHPRRRPSAGKRSSRARRERRAESPNPGSRRSSGSSPRRCT